MAKSRKALTKQEIRLGKRIDMERGYVKLWRKTLDSGIIENAHAWQLFGYLLMNTAHTQKKISYGGQIAELQPGDTVFSRGRVAKILNMSEKNARTALDFLKKLKIVATKTANRFTIVSFVNWNTYQQQANTNGPAERPTVGQQPASNRPTVGQQPATVLECKNIRIKNIYNTPPYPPNGESSDQSPEQGDDFQSDTPSLEFQELREYYTANFRSEPQLAGFPEWKQIRRCKFPIFPGVDTIYRDLDARQKSGFWNKGYAPSLARYLKERTWESATTNPHKHAPYQPRAKPGEFDLQNQIDIAHNVLAKLEAEDGRQYTDGRAQTQDHGFNGSGNELRQGAPRAAHAQLDAPAQ